MVVVVTKPWEPEMRHVSQDLTGGVRCTQQMQHRRFCKECCPRGGSQSASLSSLSYTIGSSPLSPGVLPASRHREGKTGEINPRGS